MAAAASGPKGPDLAAGVPLADLPASGVLAGHVAGEPVLLCRIGGELSAVGGACTHYGGALAEGIVVGDTVRCPLHHACFSLKTGEALRAPAFDPLDRWAVEERDGVVRVGPGKLEPRPRPAARKDGAVARIVIVGGGAAGFAAAEMLRRRGYDGALTMLSAEAATPIDRPNVSKDYLAGTAPEAWMPLKDDGFYADHRIDLWVETPVTGIDPEARVVETAEGKGFAYDRLLLATGSEPVRLNTPGFDRENVHTLRTLADARAIIAATQGAARVAVIGASFIGLEAAAALRSRGLEVHVIAPDETPMERVLGRELGAHIRRLHEDKGVVFHVKETAESFDGRRLRLSGGGEVACDLVVLGVGVRPRTGLAEAAGLATDNGVIVDAFLETSRPGVFAAGDIARHPDPLTGEPVRIEHWVVAERQGQVAALNMLGERTAYRSTPFFWSNHYDLSIHYVGHASSFDEAVVDGSIAAGDATVRYRKAGRLLAAASIGRPHENLAMEAQMEAAVSARAGVSSASGGPA
jgi:NADPH-dependent 2,4-dienoyl-CoA reductase/sulfur reductase-like enzyme/nitrite reductase/ring-hydroxylating ferredoxin subunit